MPQRNDAQPSPLRDLAIVQASSKRIMRVKGRLRILRDPFYPATELHDSRLVIHDPRVIIVDLEARKLVYNPRDYPQEPAFAEWLDEHPEWPPFTLAATTNS